MSQLFNTSDPIHTSANIPPPPPPPTTPPIQGQMFHRKPRFKLRTRIFGVLAMLVVAVSLPAIVILSRQQQTFQGSAHAVQPTVTSTCSNSNVQLTSKYVISNVPSGATCQVTASDSESFLNDSFSASSTNNTHSKTANTNKSTIPPGVLTYNTTCSDGFKDTTQVSYSQKQICITPTPSPTITPKPTITPTKKPTNTPTPTLKLTGTPTPTLKLTGTPTPTLKLTGTPTPTLCITPGQVQNVKVTCSNCSTQ